MGLLLKVRMGLVGAVVLGRYGGGGGCGGGGEEVARKSGRK